MVAKLGAILVTCVFSQNEVFSEDDVDATSLLSLRGVVHTRQSCPVTPSGAKQVYYQIAEMVGECREVIMGETKDNNHTTGATCPSGYMAITQHAECYDACDVLGYTFKMPSSIRHMDTWAPNGCYTELTYGYQGSGACHFNINKEGDSKRRHFESWYDSSSISMCMKRSSESWKDITVIWKASRTLASSASTAKVYIQFPGDDRKYQLDNPMRDRKRGATNRFALTVSANADVTRPTTQINGSVPTVQDGGWHSWKMKSLNILDETGALVELRRKAFLKICGYLCVELGFNRELGKNGFGKSK